MRPVLSYDRTLRPVLSVFNIRYWSVFYISQFDNFFAEVKNIIYCVEKFRLFKHICCSVTFVKHSAYIPLNFHYLSQQQFTAVQEVII